MEKDTLRSSTSGSYIAATSSPAGLAVERKQSEFDREGGNLSLNIESLLKVVSILEDRISGILRPQELKDGKDTEILDCSTELGRFIRVKTEQVHHANKRIQDILSRIEI